ncbi:hypothetical protein MYCTH_2124418 [Thermothelomyces thermophilus ATCC 42464]|uniref:Uncharacterized protein n=1 Tax=Thermothelomyces thermophilus (strain ATCC 42464 / BCRC 31852 / DSM 1799) TaxID=573729 RepID=G2Q5P3_THET4|nr:uncharacterized protein MYCTH_2124418 [Thermothelomyces thermophilus ATCC 42464]AEO55479.1 hypothetical protein MYCTH_2124418 [Thermothelomyces thermophilus ATCC 42464]
MLTDPKRIKRRSDQPFKSQRSEEWTWAGTVFDKLQDQPAPELPDQDTIGRARKQRRVCLQAGLSMVSALCMNPYHLPAPGAQCSPAFAAFVCYPPPGPTPPIFVARHGSEPV